MTYTHQKTNKQTKNPTPLYFKMLINKYQIFLLILIRHFNPKCPKLNINLGKYSVILYRVCRVWYWLICVQQHNKAWWSIYPIDFFSAGMVWVYTNQADFYCWSDWMKHNFNNCFVLVFLLWCPYWFVGRFWRQALITERDMVMLEQKPLIAEIMC